MAAEAAAIAMRHAQSGEHAHHNAHGGSPHHTAHSGSSDTTPLWPRHEKKTSSDSQVMHSASTRETPHRNHAGAAKPPVLDRSKSVTAQNMDNTVLNKRCCLLKALAGNKPMICPSKVPLDLLFFRRIFSNLHRRYGNGQGEVPVAVFQRSVVRLLKVLGMKAEFNASEYDVDGSGAVGWYEFVTCWQRSKMSVNLSTAERAFLAMEDPSTCFLGQVISISITLLILFSCICFIVGTLPNVKDNEGCPTCEPEQPVVLDYLEGICVGVFTLEYLVRLFLAPLSRSELLDYEKILEFVTEHQDLSIPTCSRRLFLFLIQPMNVIDLFVIAPYYLELMVGFVWSNLTVLRVLRLTRLFRLVKLGRYFEVLQLVVRVINKSLEVLNVLFIYLMLGMCFASALMYVIEGGDWDPEKQDYIRKSHEGESSVSPFKSIPHSCWWCIVTFTTVGYGDVVPVTTLGKLVAACTMIAGVLVLAMPISAISLNFGQVWEEWVEERRMEAESRHVDVLSVTKALQGMESRSRLLFELYDDALGGGHPEFLGEVDLRDLPVDSVTDVNAVDGVYDLQANLEKRPSEKVAGTVLVGYTWKPKREHLGDDLSHVNHNVKGTLEVRIQRAEALSASDWKKGGLRDVYVEVHCWPNPPSDLQEEGTKSKTFRTRTVFDTLEPVWKQTCSFEYDWPRDWRPVEESMFGHSRFWMGKEVPHFGIDGSQSASSNLAKQRSRSSDALSTRSPAPTRRQNCTSTLERVVSDGEDQTDMAAEEAAPSPETGASSRRKWRTQSQMEQDRIHCIHGFYRQRSEGEAGLEETAGDTGVTPTGHSGPLLAHSLNGTSHRDVLPSPPSTVPPLMLPCANGDTGELPALRRCVEEQGRELRCLSSRMAEMQSMMVRLEALLLRGRAHEEPPHTTLKDAAEASALSETDPSRLAEVPGCLPDGHPPD